MGRALVSPLLCRLPTGQLGDPEGGTPPPSHARAAAPRSDSWALPLPAQHYLATGGDLTARPGPPESLRQADCSPVCCTPLPRPPGIGSQLRVQPQCSGSPVRGRYGPHGGARDMKQPWRQGRDTKDRCPPGHTHACSCFVPHSGRGLAVVRQSADTGWGTEVDASWAQGHSDQLRPRPAGHCLPLPAVKWRTVKSIRGWDGAGTSLNTGRTPGDSGPASEKSPGLAGWGNSAQPSVGVGPSRAPRPPARAAVSAASWLRPSASAPASVWVGLDLAGAEATLGGEDPLVGQHAGCRRGAPLPGEGHPHSLKFRSQWKIWLSTP